MLVAVDLEVGGQTLSGSRQRLAPTTHTSRRRIASRSAASTHSSCADTERVPLDGVVPAAWRAAVIGERGRVERIPYSDLVV